MPLQINTGFAATAFGGKPAPATAWLLAGKARGALGAHTQRNR
jgi:hypothetical protein